MVALMQLLARQFSYCKITISSVAQGVAIKFELASYHCSTDLACYNSPVSTFHTLIIIVLGILDYSIRVFDCSIREYR